MLLHLCSLKAGQARKGNRPAPRPGGDLATVSKVTNHAKDSGQNEVCNKHTDDYRLESKTERHFISPRIGYDTPTTMPPKLTPRKPRRSRNSITSAAITMIAAI